jgi:SAM-dependent methyltransferase
LNVPWQAKIAAKLVLARLPFNHDTWRRLSVFQLGEMEDPAYALNVFHMHFDRFTKLGRSDGFVGLELGPGDTVSSAMVARAYGASRCYLVDVAPFARRDLEPYRALADFLAAKGLPARDLRHVHTFEELLQACAAEYYTEGLESLRSLPDGSVDFVWSHAVLEHVRRAELPETLRELRRITRPGGMSSHRIDLRDHLADALNNLRFSERIWESRLMSNSGFYTNRFRSSELIAQFRDAGFEVADAHFLRWGELPTPRSKLARTFRALSDDELRVADLDVVLRPA